VGGERVNGDEGKGIWLMDFINLCEIDQRNLLQLLMWGRERVEGEKVWG
jgi:hypothetical protein